MKNKNKENKQEIPQIPLLNSNNRAISVDALTGVVGIYRKPVITGNHHSKKLTTQSHSSNLTQDLTRKERENSNLKTSQTQHAQKLNSENNDKGDINALTGNK